MVVSGTLWLPSGKGVNHDVSQVCYDFDLCYVKKKINQKYNTKVPGAKMNE